MLDRATRVCRRACYGAWVVAQCAFWYVVFSALCLLVAVAAIPVVLLLRAWLLS